MVEEFHPEALHEFTEAALFYEAEQPGLGRNFHDAVYRCVSNLLTLPFSAPEAEDFPGIRCKPLSQFPYQLIYAVEDARLLILAVAHQRRRPGYWARRLS